MYLRELVAGVNTLIPLANNTYTKAINFDNAASTPPLLTVMQEINNLAPWYASVHRGAGYKSALSTDVYENGRLAIQNFVHSDPEQDVVVYTKNTTESINMLSHLMFNHDKNAVILSTWMEHLANDLPWRNKFIVDYVEIDAAGRLHMDDLAEKLEYYKGRVKLVAVTGASNITGYLNQVHKIAALAHSYGAQILVDGAQLVPHVAVDMKPFGTSEHIDFLAFSAHKMYAPFGIGVLIGPKNFFEVKKPLYQGGGNVILATHQDIFWDIPPTKHEAGSPNVIGVAALTAAINTLQSIGIAQIEAAEDALTNYAFQKMLELPDVELYTQSHEDIKKVGIISFNIKGVHHSITAKALSEEAGITVRNGLFCAHAYVMRLLGLTSHQFISYLDKNSDTPFPGLVRASFGMYNDQDEVDLFIEALERIRVVI